MSLTLVNVFGHQTTIKGNLIFVDRETVFYLSGKLGVFHSLNESVDQKFINMFEESRITAVAYGSTNLLAIASVGQPPTVSVMDLKAQIKKMLPKAEETSSQEYVFLSFSEDGSLLGGQGGPPEWPFVLWSLEMNRLEIVLYPFRMREEAEIYKFAFRPDDPRNIIAVGSQFLRFYEHKASPQPKMQETALHKLERSNRKFHCVVWFGRGQAAVGTSEGEILVLEEGKVATEVLLSEQMSNLERDQDDEAGDVNVVLKTSDGMICSYGKFSILILTSDFNIIKILKLPVTSEKSYITQLALNDDYMAATTKDGRMLYYKLANHLEDHLFRDQLRLLQDFQQTGRVACADSAKHLPLQVTCSADLILRDARTGKVLVRYCLGSTPKSVSLHPLGTNVVVAIGNEVKYFSILHDTLVEDKDFEKTHQTEVVQVAFAPSGHMMAITEEKHVDLFYSTKFKKLSTFIRHKTEVQIIVWRNDNCLLSSEVDGSLHEWDILCRKQSWHISFPGLELTCLSVPTGNPEGNAVYVASSDRKIRLVKDGNVQGGAASTSSKVTAMIAVNDILVAGTEKGTVLGFSTSLSGPFFESQCHVADIIHVSVCGSMAVVVGSDGITSYWKSAEKKKDDDIKVLEEVFTEIESQEAQIQEIDELEGQLRSVRKRSKEDLSRQEKELQSIIVEHIEKYKSIQLSLQSVVADLKKKIQEIEKTNEENISNRISTTKNEMKENEDDFEDKMTKEEEYLERATAERTAAAEDLVRRIQATEQEKQSSLEAFQQRYSKHEEKVRELEGILKQEQDIHQKIGTEREDFYSGQGDQGANGSNHQPESQDDSGNHEEEERLISEIEEAKKQVAQEENRGRSLDAEMKNKRIEYQMLRKNAEEIALKVKQVESDIKRMKRIIEEKGEMKQKLDNDVIELSVETEDSLHEYEDEKQIKEQELKNLKRELKKCRDGHRVLSVQLQRAKREEITLNERLKSTENSVQENAKELFAAELLLERCRSEFESLTADCPTKSSLRRVLLRLYDRRVLTTRTKEETVFTYDIDPYTSFYRQRDHYESLIHVVRGRTSQIKETFRGHYVKLAKENSDWTSIAEALRSDIRQQKSRIKALESALGLSSGQFRLDPVETGRRLRDVADSLGRTEEAETADLEQKREIAEKLEKEVRRLHGLITVGEKGKIIRRMPR